MLNVKEIEYNEYVVGYVITFEDGRSINVQYEPCFSNHPQPDIQAQIGCAGDETIDAFNQDEIDYIRNVILKNNDEIIGFGKMLDVVTYSDKKDLLTCPLDYSYLEELIEEIKNME